MPGIDADRARDLREAGWSYQRIGAELGCSGTTIRLTLNPAAMAAKMQTTREWRQANPGYQRRSYAASAEKRRAYQREWNRANPEKMRAINRQNYLKHKEARQEYGRQRRKGNPEYQARARERRMGSVRQRFAASASAAARRAKKAGIPFEKVDLEALCERDSWTCQICSGPVDRTIMAAHHPLGMSFDHVVPESAGGGWMWANLQLAHRGCNVMRGDIPLAEAREFARDFLTRLAAQ